MTGARPSAPRTGTWPSGPGRAYRAWAIVTLGAIAVAAAPWVIGEGAQRFLSEALLMLAMAQMWNLLAGYAGLSPECCRFGYTAYGKPFLLGPPALTRLQFNLAHSDGLALVAVACDRAVGVDLERIRPDVDVADVGRLVFSQAERHALDRVRTRPPAATGRRTRARGGPCGVSAPGARRRSHRGLEERRPSLDGRSGDVPGREDSSG